MNRRSRLGTIDLLDIPGSHLVKAVVSPVSDRALRLLTCFGVTADNRAIRLGTLLVGFDLTPTAIWSPSGAKWLTNHTARHLLGEVEARLRRMGGIW